MHIEIRQGSTAQEQTGTSRSSGKPYSIRTQEAWAQFNGETRRVKLTLGREQPAYAEGVYDLDDASFEVNRWGEFAIGRVVLKPRSKVSGVAGRQAG